MILDLSQFNIPQILDKSSKIMVGMSGGVDSAVAALILKSQGHDVIAGFMKNWNEVDEHGNCNAESDYKDVMKVCESLDIPYYAFDFSKEYYESVFKNFIEDYKNGDTPNPDVFCNIEIKFNHFFKSALSLGVDYVATGHYCSRIYTDSTWHLAKGRDHKKDQSYFLSGINGEVLDRVLFPLGLLEKTKVREIAQHFNLVNAKKKDSTGVCFIGERNFRKFLSEYIDSTKGEFQKLDGTIVGAHDGACFFTLGQRKGLGLGGPGEPWYVIKKDHTKNIVYVEREKDHPELFRKNIKAKELNWINFKPSDNFQCKAKIRYRQLDQDCTVKYINGLLEIDFKQPQRAVCKKQIVAFYNDEICLGSALIE